jgi:hypothetical protein
LAFDEQEKMKTRIIPDEEQSLDELVVRARKDPFVKDIVSGKKPVKRSAIFGLKACKQASDLIELVATRIGLDKFTQFFHERKGSLMCVPLDNALYCVYGAIAEKELKYEEHNINSIVERIMKAILDFHSDSLMDDRVGIPAAVALGYHYMGHEDIARKYLKEIEENFEFIRPKAGPELRLYKKRDLTEFCTADNALMSVLYSVLGEKERAVEIVDAIEAHITPFQDRPGTMIRYPQIMDVHGRSIRFFDTAMVRLAQSFAGKRMEQEFLILHRMGAFPLTDGMFDHTCDNLALALLYMRNAYNET